MSYLHDLGTNVLRNGLVMVEDDDDFQVLGYTLVMRIQFTLEGSDRPSGGYIPKCHSTVYSEISDWTSQSGTVDAKTYNFTFWPLYIMHYGYNHKRDDGYHHERYIYYGGMTNSGSDRFKNHKALNDFIEYPRGREDKQLHMCQLLVTFQHNGTFYKNTPIEWLNFTADHDKDSCKTLINKMIVFVETTALISANTDRNIAYCIPNVSNRIYTANLRIIDGVSGTIFQANNSIHPFDGVIDENDPNYPYHNGIISPEKSYALEVEDDLGRERSYWAGKIYVNANNDSLSMFEFDDYINLGDEDL